jgi:hypothetical protein
LKRPTPAGSGMAPSLRSEEWPATATCPRLVGSHSVVAKRRERRMMIPSRRGERESRRTGRESRRLRPPAQATSAETQRSRAAQRATLAA